MTSNRNQVESSTTPGTSASTANKLDPQAIWSLADTRQSLESLLQHMHNATTLLDNSISQESNPQLHNELNDIINDLSRLKESTQREVYVNIPTAVIDSINNGINPSTVTSNLLLYGRTQNDLLREKLNNTYIAHQLLKQGNEEWKSIEQQKNNINQSSTHNKA